MTVARKPVELRLERVDGIDYVHDRVVGPERAVLVDLVDERVHEVAGNLELLGHVGGEQAEVVLESGVLSIHGADATTPEWTRTVDELLDALNEVRG